MSVIIPNKLFLGNIVNASRLEWMNKQNINTVICVASERDVMINDNVKSNKIVYQFDILDIGCQVLDFDPIVDLIHNSFKNGAVLVNCAVGISRSASFVIAYLMKYHKMSLNRAFTIVKTLRPKINPNPSFMIQLQNYEKKLSNMSLNLTPPVPPSTQRS